MSLFDLPDPEDPKPGKAGRDHPPTSKQSAQRGAPGFATQRGIVLAYVATRSRGATAAEVADAHGWSRNQIATRLLELREQGWLQHAIEDGEPVVRSTGGGHSGLVHVLREDARMDYARWSAARNDR